MVFPSEADYCIGESHKPKVNEKLKKEEDVERKLERLREGIIGSKALFEGPFGRKPIVYADWTASARAYAPIEDFIRQDVLPYYANTHTFTSITGLQSTWSRAEARQIIQQAVNGNSKKDVVLFKGSGVTAGINQMLHVLGLSVPLPVDTAPDMRPVVFVGPYEHHSNLLPWRESNADVVAVSEDKYGQVDLVCLENLLIQYQNRPLRVGSFSACSNVTGVLTDVNAVTALLHRHGALSFWDYASAAPYVKIDMNPVLDGDHPDRSYVHKDAIFISTHKFVGGINSPGVLVMKKRLLENAVPATTGGGTVFFVTDNSHRYLSKRAEREEGGTPDIIGAIRAGLTFQLKQSIGLENIVAKEEHMWNRIATELGGHPKIKLLGPPPQENVKRLPIASFLIQYRDEMFLHYNFVSALLNDLYGIQSRGGCMCAGPYSLRLLGMKPDDIEAMEMELVDDPKNSEFLRPGYTRISFTYFTSDDEASFVIKAIQSIAKNGWMMLPYYRFNQRTGEWKHKSRITKDPERRWLSHAWLTGPQKYKYEQQPVEYSEKPYTKEYFDSILDEAKTIIDIEGSKKEQLGDQTKLLGDAAAKLRWFVLPSEALTEKKKMNNRECDASKNNGTYQSKSSPVFDPRRYWKALDEFVKNETVEGTATEAISDKKRKTDTNCQDGSCFRTRSKDKYPLRDVNVIRSASNASMSNNVNTSPKAKKMKFLLEENLVDKKAMDKAILRPIPPKKLMTQVGKAMMEWDMVEEGDKLLLGLSGGKDSLALLHILLEKKKRSPINFEVAACTIDPMTEAFDPSPLIPYMASLGVTYHYVKTPIFENAKSGSLDGTSICSYCARMKRGALYGCARKHGYTKLVLAQHLDDNAESFLMSFFHNGQLRSMKANYTEKKGDITVIRPLCYVREHDLKEFSYSAKLPVINENCPACFEAPQERKRMKKLLAKEEAFAPNIFNAMRTALKPLLDEETLLNLADFTKAKRAKGRVPADKRKRYNPKNQNKKHGDE